MSLDPIVVTAPRVGFPGESHGPATCGFACNCPEPEAWTTEAGRANEGANKAAKGLLVLHMCVVWS